MDTNFFKKFCDITFSARNIAGSTNEYVLNVLAFKMILNQSTALISYTAIRKEEQWTKTETSERNKVIRHFSLHTKTVTVCSITL